MYSDNYQPLVKSVCSYSTFLYSVATTMYGHTLLPMDGAGSLPSKAAKFILKLFYNSTIFSIISLTLLLFAWFFAPIFILFTLSFETQNLQENSATSKEKKPKVLEKIILNPSTKPAVSDTTPDLKEVREDPSQSDTEQTAIDLLETLVKQMQTSEEYTSIEKHPVKEDPSLSDTEQTAIDLSETLIEQMQTSEEYTSIEKHPGRLYQLIPFQDNNQHRLLKDNPPEKELLTGAKVHAIQTNPEEASRYLAGIFTVLKFLGISLDSQGCLQRSSNFSERQAHIQAYTQKDGAFYGLLIARTALSLAECGLGLLARQVLLFFRNEDTAYSLPSEFYWRTPWNCLTKRALSKALPAARNRQSHIVDEWGIYLCMNYFSDQPPSSSEQQRPQWFSLPKAKESDSLEAPSPSPDPIFTVQATSAYANNKPLLCWNLISKKWYLPHWKNFEI